MLPVFGFLVTRRLVSCSAPVVVAVSARWESALVSVTSDASSLSFAQGTSVTTSGRLPPAGIVIRRVCWLVGLFVVVVVVGIKPAGECTTCTTYCACTECKPTVNPHAT